MNPKTLQYLMRHSDISVTMNVYTHISFDDAEEELKRMEEFRKAQAEVEKKDEKPMSPSLGVICEKKAVCGPEKINIIEGSTGERVTLLDDENINMALSKMTFANLMLEGKTPFDEVDFKPFVPIFDILKKIYLDSDI